MSDSSHYRRSADRYEDRIKAEVKDLSDYLEGDLGNVAHIAIEYAEDAPKHPWCETPRHQGQQRRSVEYWIFTKYNYGEPAFVAMCEECSRRMYEIACVAVDAWRLTPEFMDETLHGG